MYFYVIENGQLIDEVAVENHSEYELEKFKEELQDKNGSTVTIAFSEKRLKPKEIEKI